MYWAVYANAAVWSCVSGLYLPGTVSRMSSGDQDAGLVSLQTLTRMIISVAPRAVTFSSAESVLFFPKFEFVAK